MEVNEQQQPADVEDEVDEEAIKTDLLNKLKPIEASNNEKLKKVEEASKEKRKIEKRVKRKREEEDLYPFQKKDPEMNPVLKHQDTKAQRQWKKAKEDILEAIKPMLNGETTLEEVFANAPERPKAAPGTIEESAEKLIAWVEKDVPEEIKKFAQHFIPVGNEAEFLKDMLGPARFYWRMGMMDNVMTMIFKLAKIQPSQLAEKQKSADELKNIIVEALERLERLEPPKRGFFNCSIFK